MVDCIEQDSLNYSHSENLHVFIKELLNKNNTEFNQLSAISVSRGPGSYTGLRIGLSAAKGLCYGLDIPLISISSLKILANSIKYDGFIVSTMDARRDEVYSCIYDSNLNVIREEKPEIINHESFIDFLFNQLIDSSNGHGSSRATDPSTHSPDYNLASETLSKRFDTFGFRRFSLNRFEWAAAHFASAYLNSAYLG